MRKHQLGRALGALFLAIAAMATHAAAAAAAPTVTVRVEGQSATLLPETPVELVAGGGAAMGCDDDSLFAAIEDATGGDWDQTAYYPTPTTILGEGHVTAERSAWRPWVKRAGEETWEYWMYAYFGNGYDCNGTPLAEGDRVLLQATKLAPPETGADPPLARAVDVAAPPVVEVGDPFEVAVTAYRGAPVVPMFDPFPGLPEVGAGYTVTGAASPAVTDAQGKATLIAASPGIAQLKAASGDPDDWGRSALTPVCVHDGDDGRCPPKIELPDAVDLGEVSTSGTVMRPVRLTARRNDLDVGGVRLVGGGSAGIYLLDGDCEGSTIEMATSCDLMVLFSPSASGAVTATLEIESDAVEEPLATVELTGSGVTPPTVAGPQGPPGSQGLQGPGGTAGPKGDRGARGPAGRDARVTCRLVKQRGKKQTVRCTVSLKGAGKSARRLSGRTRATLARNGRVAAAGPVSSLRAKRALAKGRYTLRIGRGKSVVRIPVTLR